MANEVKVDKKFLVWVAFIWGLIGGLVTMRVYYNAVNNDDIAKITEPATTSKIEELDNRYAHASDTSDLKGAFWATYLAYSNLNERVTRIENYITVADKALAIIKIKMDQNELAISNVASRIKK